MSALDNLLNNVPTDLWINGKGRKSSDGTRFDVIDPATEQKIASAIAALSMRFFEGAIYDEAASSRSVAKRRMRSCRRGA